MIISLSGRKIFLKCQSSTADFLIILNAYIEVNLKYVKRLSGFSLGHFFRYCFGKNLLNFLVNPWVFLNKFAVEFFYVEKNN
jgi:hypothetical protein